MDIINALPLLILICDRTGRIAIANRIASAMLGTDIEGMDCAPVLQRASIRRPGGSLLKVNEMPEHRVLQGETVSDDRVILTDCFGTDHAMSISAIPLLAGRAITGVVISCQEPGNNPGISLPAAARNTCRDFSIIAAAPIGIALCNTEGQVLEMNSAFRDILRARSAAEPGDYNLFSDTAIPDLEKERMREGRVVRCTIPVGGGEPAPVKMTYLDLQVIPIRGLSAPVEGYAAWLQDTTRWIRTEEIHRIAFEQINRNIEQFAVIGDHIRQPLQVIMGIAGFIEGDDANTILCETRVINDILQQLDRGWIESRKVREFLTRNRMS